jgi:hypothetical protein
MASGLRVHQDAATCRFPDAPPVVTMTVPPTRGTPDALLVLLGGDGHFDGWEAASKEIRDRSLRDYNTFANAVRASEGA